MQPRVIATRVDHIRIANRSSTKHSERNFQMNTNFRNCLRSTCIVGAVFLLVLLAVSGYAQLSESGVTADDTSIRPFHIHVPESAMVDLRQPSISLSPRERTWMK